MDEILPLIEHLKKTKTPNDEMAAITKFLSIIGDYRKNQALYQAFDENDYHLRFALDMDVLFQTAVEFKKHLFLKETLPWLAFELDSSLMFHPLFNLWLNEHWIEQLRETEELDHEDCPQTTSISSSRAADK